MPMTRADGGTDYVNVYLNINDGGAKMPIESDQDRKTRTGLSSLQMTDDESAAVQKTEHRVTLASMTDRIEDVEYLHPTFIPHMTIAIVLLENGFALVGHSAPADAENFDEELGRKFAFENALRQMWPLEAYLLREKLFQGD